MNLRNLCLATVAYAAISPTFAAPADSASNEKARDTAAAAATLTDDIVAGMRKLLDTVAPEISLPAIEIRLPTLGVEQG